MSSEKKVEAEPARDPDALPRGIGRPATNALAAAGYTRLSQLARLTEDELSALHGVGPKAVRILRETLAEAGLGFAAPATPATSRAKR